MKFKNLLNFVLKNFWYKIASLFLAVLVWALVQGEEIVDVNRKIRVNISVANGYLVKDKAFRFLEATLHGPRVLLGEISSQPLEGKIFIPSGQVGNLEVPFDSRGIKGLDSRIKIDIKDPYISVFIDEKSTREINVREVLRGAPAEGFFVEKVLMEPAKIEVSGLKSEIAKLEELNTEPIDITSINQSKTLDARIDISKLNSVELSHDFVKVKLQVGESKVNKRFASIPIDIVGSIYVTSVKPKVVSIVIQGTPGVLSFVEKKSLRAFVEVGQLAPGRHEKEIQVKIPPDTVLIETVPEKANVFISSERRIN